jgi:outer membrane protein
VGTATVEKGRQEVAVIQAQNLYDTERLRLMQQLGVEFNEDIELISTFQVFEPHWTTDALVEQALRTHPQLQSARRTESAASAAAKAQWSNYLPTLSLNGSFAGYVSQIGSNQYVIDQARSSAANRVESCEFNNALNSRLTSPLPDLSGDCSKLAYTDAVGDAAVRGNSLFPFNYTGSPAYFSMTISLPIFDGFTRERQVQAARAQAEDAKFNRRAEELTRRTEVTANLLALRAAYRTVQLEERNATTAGEQLELSSEMYRLGAGSILELTTAQESKVRADQAHLAAIYTFHETLAALEAATGEPLRTTARPADESSSTRER